MYGDLGYRNAVSLDRLKTEAKSGEYDAIIHVGGKAAVGWLPLSRVIEFYNPSINFCVLSLNKTDQVMQNRTMVIRGYPPSDLISVV